MNGVNEPGDIRLFYTGYYQGTNIEKHAGAPLIPQEKYPYPPYQHLNRLSIKPISNDLKGKDIESMHVSDIVCRANHEKELYEQIFNTGCYENDCIAYATCKHTIFAAAKRQMKAAPLPDYEVARDFVEYSKKIIDKEVGEDLKHFTYSTEDWLNHLTRQKQINMIHAGWVITKDPRALTLEPTMLKKINDESYHGIAKVEIQNTDGKPRMVCAIPEKTKYTMGPVTWQLEEIFADKFHGYCGGQNLTQMAEKVNTYAKMGFTKVVEGDGSAFDNTQDVMLKAVDRYIYDQVEHAVYHVPKELFRKYSQQVIKTMSIDYTENGHIKTMLRYKILGTVFSGDCDTTLMNTVRMALYNRYVNDKAGLIYGKDYVLFSKGDDFTIMYKPYVSNEFITQAYYKYFLKANPDPSRPDTRRYGLGQVLKFLEFGGLEILKFCSLRAWYKNDEEIILTRDPSKFTTLSKYSRKTKNMNTQQRADYLIQQAVALLTSYGDIEYFRVMAQLYVRAASQILKYHHIIYTQPKNTNLQTKDVRKLVGDDVYKYLNIIDEREFINQILYSIGHRKHQYSLQSNMTYWENMKKIERIRTDRLTQDEADYVNKQIRLEYSTEYLKSMLGFIDPKNE